MKIKLKELFTNIISGEWGEDDIDETGVPIIRTANFLNDGKINYNNIVTRRIVKRILDEHKGETWIIDEERIQNKKLQDGDIIIEKSGGGVGTPVGRVVHFLAPDKRTYLANNFTQVLRVNANLAAPKYIFYLLKYLYRKGTVLKYQNQTTGIFNLKLERYLQEEIDLPSIDIQFNIIAQLDLFQDLIDNRIKSVELIEQLYRTSFFTLFGDPYVNKKKWALKSLNELKQDSKNSIKSGPFGSSLKKEFYVKKGYKIYGQEQVIRNDFSYGNYYIDARKYKELAACKIQANDILISSMGTFGKISIVPENFEAGIINPRLIKITFNRNEIEPIYFKGLFETDYLKAYLSSKSKGGTLNSINLKTLQKMVFPVPDIKLQQKYSEIAKIIQGFKTLLINSHNLLSRLYEVAFFVIFREEAKVDEDALFKDLIKNLNLNDLRGHKKRLQYLIDLFQNAQFDNLTLFSDAREKLFSLMAEEEIIQVLNNDEITLKVK